MKNILVPIDCSDATPHVLDQAKQLARAFDAQIHLVHVREVTPSAPPNTFDYGVAGMPELMPMSSNPMPMVDQIPAPTAAAESKKLADWQREIREAGLKVTSREPTGAVVEEILREAHTVNPDLIVMGRHGHGAMHNLLVGSVTEGVLKRSGRPVLLVPSVR